MLDGHDVRAVASGLFATELNGQTGMLPAVNLTSGGIVKTVCRGGLSKPLKVVAMSLCSETPPKAFLSCLAGDSVVESDWDTGPAEATLENVRAPSTPSAAP